MKVEILINDGSPIGVTMKTLWGERSKIGVGGAELALLTMCEAWHNAGHEVILYNSPRDPYGSPFEQRNISDFDPKKNRDFVIIFRSPNPKGLVSKGLKFWWSTDQFTVGDFRSFSHHVDKIICISEFHQKYFEKTYGINGSIIIDLPVRVNDYIEPQAKIPNRLIFTSIPDRGLQFLRHAWPQLKKEVPDLSLVITSDYRLWGADGPRNEKHRVHWIGQKDVKFLGAITRQELIQHELEAQILAYPCLYDELFCISCAEAQVAGAYPITSSIGALETTNMGTIIHGHPQDIGFLTRFTKEIVELLNNPDELKKKQDEVKQKATERFHPDNILKQWNSLVFGGDNG